MNYGRNFNRITLTDRLTSFFGCSWLRPVSASISIAILCNSAVAMTFTLHDPCGGGNGEICAPRILGAGVIEEGDAARLKAKYQEWARKDGADFSGITLHSPGGNLGAGLELGREIRRLKLDTIAPNQFMDFSLSKKAEQVVVQSVQCLSACAYAFAGGVHRTIENGSVIGVHQFASAVPGYGHESRAQVTGTLLRVYLQEMGVRPLLVDIASIVPPNAMHVLSATEIKQTRMDNTEREISAWEIVAETNGQPMLVQKLENDVNTPVTLALMRSGDAFILKLGITHPTSMDRKRLQLFPVGKNPDVELVIHPQTGFDVKKVKAKKALQAWAPVPSIPRTFLAAVQVDAEFVAALAGSAQVTLYDDVGGRALRDLVPYAIDLSPKGLRDGIQLLLRVN